jgi:hypothetical protein
MKLNGSLLRDMRSKTTNCSFCDHRFTTYDLKSPGFPYYFTGKSLSRPLSVNFAYTSEYCASQEATGKGKIPQVNQGGLWLNRVTKAVRFVYKDTCMYLFVHIMPAFGALKLAHDKLRRKDPKALKINL